MSRDLTVRFTEAEARAVDHALAYMSAGEPDDVGLQDDAEGRRVMAAAKRAHDKLARAW